MLSRQGSGNRSLLLLVAFRADPDSHGLEFRVCFVQPDLCVKGRDWARAEAAEPVGVEAERFGGGVGGALGELKDVEGGTQHAGVGEGAKLADEAWGVRCVGWQGGQERFGECGEIALLSGKAEGFQAEGPTGLNDAGEINMDADVLLSGGDEGVITGFMVRVGAEGAFRAGWVVVVGLRESVVDEDEQGGVEDLGEGREEAAVLKANFGGVVVGEILAEFSGGGGERSIGDVAERPGEVFAFQGDAAFFPSAVVEVDEVGGQGVEDFVGEDGPGFRGGIEICG